MTPAEIQNYISNVFDGRGPAVLVSKNIQIYKRDNKRTSIFSQGKNVVTLFFTEDELTGFILPPWSHGDGAARMSNVVRNFVEEELDCRNLLPSK